MANAERVDRFAARDRFAGGPFRRQGSGQDANSVRHRGVVSAMGAGDAKAALLGKLQIVKQTRFNAAKRLESAHHAGQLALAVAGIYGFLIPLFTLQFKGAIPTLTVGIIDFVAVVAGALSFAVAFLYQERDYKGRAVRMHACALEINGLRHQLAATRIGHEHELQPFVRAYNEILSRFENHDEIDYRLARAQRACRQAEKDGRRGDRRRLRRLRAERFLLTHGLNVLIWGMPPLVGIMLCLLLPSTT